MGTSFLTGLGVAWILVGVVLSVVMRRRGHDLFVWLVLGAVLGPLSVPLAIERLRIEAVHPSQPAWAPGECDLLAGLDGSPESVEAVRRAVRLFGTRVTSVTLATVLDHDSRDSTSGGELHEAAHVMLERARETLELPAARIEVLYGRPDSALTAYARSGGMDCVVVGGRGHGASEALFGSVTERLVADSPVPVLVGPRADR
jgi:nucleotide-binding universal stress UspA family protein